MKLEVHKFGGGIIKDATAIKHLPEVIKKHVRQPAISVFSAFGKTTNNLEKVVNAYIAGEKTESIKTLKELKSFHLKIAHKLFPGDDVIFDTIEDIFKRVERVLEKVADTKNPKFIYDQIVPYGEMLASIIVSHYFSSVGLPNKLVHAPDFITTDSNFTSANVDKKASYEKLKEQITADILASHKIVVTQGFIGSSEQGMTTLGREGSDYTAGLIGNLTDAEKVVLWKDVPGVMDKNPKIPGNEDAQKIEAVSYEDFKKHLKGAAAGLVHPKTLNEVKEKNIPLQVRPFWDLDSEGTVIG